MKVLITFCQNDILNSVESVCRDAWLVECIKIAPFCNSVFHIVFNMSEFVAYRLALLLMISLFDCIFPEITYFFLFFFCLKIDCK